MFYLNSQMTNNFVVNLLSLRFTFAWNKSKKIKSCEKLLNKQTKFIQQFWHSIYYALSYFYDWGTHKHRLLRTRGDLTVSSIPCPYTCVCFEGSPSPHTRHCLHPNEIALGGCPLPNKHSRLINFLF